MSKVTVKVASVEEGFDRFKTAWKIQEAQGNYVTFDSVETMLKVLNGTRWHLLHVLQNAGTVSIRELARRLDRDVKRVHEDVHKLMELGLVAQEGSGVRVPFDEIKAQFGLRKTG